MPSRFDGCASGKSRALSLIEGTYTQNTPGAHLEQELCCLCGLILPRLRNLPQKPICALLLDQPLAQARPALFHLSWGRGEYCQWLKPGVATSYEARQLEISPDITNNFPFLCDRASFS